MNNATAISSSDSSNNRPDKHQQLEEWGAHCSLTTCNLLDFLPLQCPECQKKFCSRHCKPSLISSDVDHRCEQLILKSKQAANSPHPVKIPNSLGTHQSKKCSYIKCKTIMLAPINCPSCKLSYCPSHRLQQDHLCKSFNPSSSSDPGSKDLGMNVNFSNLLKNHLVNPLDPQAFKSKPPTAAPSASSTISSPDAQKNSSPNPNPFSLKQHISKIKSNQRSKAELESQQKALEFRIKNQLLTEKDKLEIRRLNEEKRQRQTPSSSGNSLGSKTNTSNDCCIV